MDKPRSLSAAIAARGIKLKHVAATIGVNRCTLREKLAGRYEWKLSELLDLKALLGMGDEFWPLIEAEHGKEEAV